MEARKRRGLVALATLVAAFIIALATALPAHAATITVNQPEDGHSYSAYQILDATVTEESNHTNVRLSNVQWGSNVNGDQLLAALKASNTPVYAATSNNGVKGNTTVGQVFANANSAADFAAVFDWASDNSALANEVAGIINQSMANSDASDDILKGNPITSQRKEDNSGYTLEANDPGYYYIQDGAASATGGKYFVQIFNDSKEIAAKNATPALEKKVLENTKYQQDGGYGTAYNDTADYSIGDDVTFKLIGSIPDMSAYNNGYRYTVVDTLSTSLDLPAASDVKVFLAKERNAAVSLDGEAPSGSVEVTSSFAVTTDPATHVITVQPNIAASENKTSGTNDLSAVPSIGEYNYVVVVYKAKLNASAALGQQTVTGNTLGESADHGNVNKAHLTYSNNPSFPDQDHHGTTPDDYVIVFTYGTDLTKVSAADTSTPLANASFILVKGTYTDNGTNQYAQLSGDATNGWRLTGWTSNRNEATTMTTQANGKVQVAGLDDGTYNLVETVTPSGFNQPSQPWTITISADTSNGQDGNGKTTELKSLSGTVANGSFTNNVAFSGQDKGLVSGEVTGSVNTGAVSATITNTQGFQLPQTGDMGTKLLIALGVAIVAAVLIIASIRKRANGAQ